MIIQIWGCWYNKTPLHKTINACLLSKSSCLPAMQHVLIFFDSTGFLHNGISPFQSDPCSQTITVADKLQKAIILFCSLICGGGASFPRDRGGAACSNACRIGTLGPICFKLGCSWWEKQSSLPCNFGVTWLKCSHSSSTPQIPIGNNVKAAKLLPHFVKETQNKKKAWKIESFQQKVIFFYFFIISHHFKSRKMK